MMNYNVQYTCMLIAHMYVCVCVCVQVDRYTPKLACTAFLPLIMVEQTTLMYTHLSAHHRCKPWRYISHENSYPLIYLH